jgi:CubicO group peptidase (beta-lactamase class C family)
MKTKTMALQTVNWLEIAISLLLAAAMLFASVMPALAQANENDGPQDAGEMEAFIDGVMDAAMRQNHVPGAIVVIVKDGEVFFASGYGYADVENKTPVDPATTLFRPGSVSKLFTWTAVMQMVEQGKIDLDADVNDYLDFKIPAAFGTPITMTHLMTHMPGFEDVGEDLFVLEAEQMISLEAYLKKNVPARVFAPGTIGAYSNYGTALAGYIVERVSGVPFNQYVAENIFLPLDMQYATFEQPLPADLAGYMSGGYNYANGEYIEGPFEFVVGAPAGSLSASGLAMANFMIAHLQDGAFNGTRILQEETARLMHSPLYQADPRMDGMAHGFFYRHYNGQLALSHGGDTMLFHSELILLPEHNLGVYISTNGTQGAVVVEGFRKAFFDRYFPQETAALTAVTEQASDPAVFSGSYTMARSNFTSLEKVINLLNSFILQATDDGRWQFNMAGNITTYVETEPGLLVNVDNPDDRVLLRVVDGQAQIVPPIPFVFLKTPWYGQTGLHLFLLIGTTVLLLLCAVVWVVNFFKRLKLKTEKPDGFTLVYRWAAGLFGLILLVFLVGFIGVMTDMHPAMGMPRAFFGMPDGMNVLLRLPLGLIVLALVMLMAAVIRWSKGSGKFLGRVFYSLLTLLAFGSLWSLYYWNLLL